MLHLVSYFFFLYWSLSSSLSTVLDADSSNIDKILSLNISATVFVHKVFIDYHREFLTYSDGSDTPFFVFLFQTNLLKLLTLQLRTLILILTVMLFWIDFYLLTLVYGLQWPSIHWKNLVMVFLVSIGFCSVSKWNVTFHHTAFNSSCPDWDGPHDHLRNILRKDIFNQGASAAASSFCELTQAGSDTPS